MGLLIFAAPREPEIPVPGPYAPFEGLTALADMGDALRHLNGLLT